MFYFQLFGENKKSLIKMIKCPSVREIDLVEFHCIIFFLVYVTKMVRVEDINMIMYDFINAL